MKQMGQIAAAAPATHVPASTQACCRGPCYTTGTMNAPDPKLPWYQFSLRSLLLLTVFVALLCSIGIRTDWRVSAVIAVIAAGGITGRIVPRTWLGFVFGIVAGGVCAAVAAIASTLVWIDVFGMPFLPNRYYDVTMIIAGFIGSLIGGIVGGRYARTRPRQHR